MMTNHFIFQVLVSRLKEYMDQQEGGQNESIGTAEASMEVEDDTKETEAEAEPETEPEAAKEEAPAAAAPGSRRSVRPTCAAPRCARHG